MKKRIVSIILALFLVIGLIPTGIITQKVSAADTVATYYFRDQLKSDGAKLFYKALEKMLSEGIFMTGNGSLELTAVEEFADVAEGLCEGHSTGVINILNEYGAGRDAFYADHPDVFYVDFSAITVRITKTEDQKFHLYLGAGRYPTYYTEGFTDKSQVEQAIDEYKRELEKLVAVGKAKSDPKDRVIAVHDYLTRLVTYRDELAVDPANIGFVRTAYGALVKHEGVCESYTRAFKAAMDALDIPCVMVSGVYRHDDKVAEAHIWNEVLINGRWYAVDVTMDDPVNPKKDASDKSGVDGYENQKYLLVGDSVMSVHHYSDGAMSPGGYEFSYPDIGGDFSTVTDEFNPLKVRYRSEAYDSEILESGTYYVSYMGMNATEMEQNGYYLLMRYKVYDVSLGWVETDWHYFMPEVYGWKPSDINVGNETRFEMPHVEYVEFGVTTVAGPKVEYNKVPDMYFHGSVDLILARSGLLHNEDGTYRAAPASLRGDPVYYRSGFEPGETKTVKAYYNDILVKPDVYETWCKPERVGEDGYEEALYSATAEDFSLSVSVQDKFLGTLKNDQSYQDPIQNVNIYFENGETVIEFTYTASNLWIDDCVAYIFHIEGLVGAYSGKKPDDFSWVCQAPCAICAYRSRGFDYNTFAKPVLVDDQDLLMDGAVASDGTVWDGTTWDENYKNRLMLVVTDSGKKDAHAMEDMIENGADGVEAQDVLSSLTYNINLTLCKLQWANLKDGMSIRIQLGFPAGFGPEDEGVTFKAYHFIKDPNTGEILDIEEIPCTITQYGLLIEVHSFSPFAICAVAADPDEKQPKTVVLTSDVGGTVTADRKGSMIQLNEGESVTVTVTADSGYVIDTIEVSDVDGKRFNEEKNSYTFTIGYDEIAESASSAVVSAAFVTETVAAEETGDAVLPVAEKPDAAVITQTNISTDRIGNVTLSVSNPNSNYTYNWYKVGTDGDTFVGSGSPLTLHGVDQMGHAVDTSGTYYCIVVATAGSTTAYSDKSANVTVISNTGEPLEFDIVSSPEAVNGVVEVGQNGEVVLTVANPDMSCEYVWYKDGAEVISTHSDNYTLALNASLDNIAGTYTCVAKNVHGSKTSKNSITVKIVSAPPAAFDITPLLGATVAEGESLTLKVENPDESLTYTWYKKGVQDEQDTVIGTGVSYTLEATVGGENVDISGTYYCVATNSDNKSTRSTNEVVVTVIKEEPVDPTFEITANGKPVDGTITIEAGEDLVLAVSNITDGYTYTWYKKGAQDEQDTVIGTGVSYTLEATVDGENVDISGTYYCVATNSDNKSTRSTNEVVVTVIKEEPVDPTFEITANGKPVDGTITLEAGEDLVLAVSNITDGYTYTWYKKGSQDEQDTVIGTGVSYTLEATVDGENVDISGTYYCVATNSDNKSTRSTNEVVVTVTKDEPDDGPTVDDNFEITANGSSVDGTVTLEVGEDLVLAVKEKVEGYTYTWYRKADANTVARINGDILLGADPVTLKSTDAQGNSIDLSGEYYCIAEKDGVSKTSASVVVNAKLPTPVQPEVPTVPHQHVLGPWDHNAYSHWVRCITCGAIITSSSHNFDENGRCLSCGYTVSGFAPDGDNAETDPNDSVTVEVPTEEPSTTDDPEEADSPASEPNPSTGLLLSPALAIAAAAVLIAKKK